MNHPDSIDDDPAFADLCRRARAAGLPTQAEMDAIMPRILESLRLKASATPDNTIRLRDVYPRRGEAWGGTFDILKPVGHGSFGTVFAARHRATGRLSAVKVLHLRTLEENTGPARERFLREGDLLTAVQWPVPHPEIVSLVDFNEIDGIPFIETELLVGMTLDALIRDPAARAGWRAAEFLNRLRPVAVALKVLHAHGITHRDLKPDNIYLASAGGKQPFTRTVLLDLGTAYTANPRMTMNLERLEPGRIVGTVGYLAPEQARCQPVDSRADLWSFGAVLLRCLSGRTPHDAYRSCTEHELVERARRGQIILPPDDGNEPPEVRALLRRALEANRRTRIQTADELLDAIDLTVVACVDWYARATERRVLRLVHACAGLAALITLLR